LPTGITWFGIDYAYTIMNPLTMHHSFVIPEMYRRLGREREGKERLARWYRLRDSMGTLSDSPDQKVTLLKEYNRDSLNREVFDDDNAAVKLYEEMEAVERRPAKGLRRALEVLKKSDKTASVVSEVSSLQGSLTITTFLKAHGLLELFDEIITPFGRFTVEGELRDESSFKGTSKRDGSIYERLAKYLGQKGIQTKRAAMIGDDPKQDIEQAKKHGFVTIHYSGLIDRGRTGSADHVIDDWSKLRYVIDLKA